MDKPSGMRIAMANGPSMVESLARSARDRYHSALRDGHTEQEAFEEIIATILKAYMEAIANG